MTKKILIFWLLEQNIIPLQTEFGIKTNKLIKKKWKKRIC